MLQYSLRKSLCANVIIHYTTEASSDWYLMLTVSYFRMCMSEGKVYSHVSSSYAVMLDNLLLDLIHV